MEGRMDGWTDEKADGRKDEDHSYIPYLLRGGG
jgi:hypothetical protein